MKGGRAEGEGGRMDDNREGGRRVEETWTDNTKAGGTVHAGTVATIHMQGWRVGTEVI